MLFGALLESMREGVAHRSAANTSKSVLCAPPMSLKISQQRGYGQNVITNGYEQI
jgi:hypothetical protein